MRRRGRLRRRSILSESDAVPSTYPVALAVTKDGRRAFVALWNASEVVELDLESGKVARRLALLKPQSAIAPGTHPCALLLDEKAGRDVCGAGEPGCGGGGVDWDRAGAELAVRGYFDTRLPGQSYFGAEPEALAMNADGTRLYVANLGSDAVAVMDPRKLRGVQKAKGMVEPLGFVPTELMPMALASTGGKLYVATRKGKGTGPNNFPQRVATDGAGRAAGLPRISGRCCMGRWRRSMKARWRRG